MTTLWILAVFLLFKGYFFATCMLDPTYIWPLGGGIGLTEIKKNSVSGTIGSVLYGTGLAAVGNYSVMEFTGTNDSFVDVNVPSNASLLGDYSIMFFVKIKNASSSSTVLHYRSSDFQAGSTSEIGEFTISVVNGNITMNFTNFGSITWYTSSLISIGQWHHVVYSRDISKPTAKLFLNGSNPVESNSNLAMMSKNTSSPGVFRIGGNMNFSNSLSGAVTCLQIAPCKDAIDLTVYAPKCNRTNWPLTTTSSAPTTTSSAPTTTSSALTTTTTTTKTTTGAVVTTSGASTATSMAPATTTMAPTTTSYTGNLDFAVTTGCNHYRMTGNDVTFGNHSDIIDVLMVSGTAKCSLECDRCAECYMFALASQGVDFECKLGVKTSNLMNQTGSRIFEN